MRYSGKNQSNISDDEILCFSSKFVGLNKFTMGVSSILIGIGLISFQSVSFLLGLVPKLTNLVREFAPAIEIGIFFQGFWWKLEEK